MKPNKLVVPLLCLGTVLFLTTCQPDELRVPQCSKVIFPLDKSFVPVGESIQLRWEHAVGAAGYDVYVGAGTEEPVLIAENQKLTELTFNVPSTENTTYSWYVLPRNAEGKCSECGEKKMTFGARTLPAFDTRVIPVNVLVLCFDPKVGDKRLHDAFSWSDPKELAAGYIEDVETASHGIIDFNIVEWKDIDGFPEKVGGFKYTFETYAACQANPGACHSPDDLDYPKLFADYNVLNGINNDVYDEVWIFGAPYFGFWESAMAGYGAFYINGAVFPEVQSKTFAIMGFSYERGNGEMIHNLCHRTEATMSRIYGGWQAEKLTTSWARFAANQKQSGVAAVGTCHYPPNAAADYDYCNERVVSSSAEDWYNYPYMTGAMAPVSVRSWAGDCQRSYLQWWFHHLPYREGTAPDGYVNNWWRYVYELQ